MKIIMIYKSLFKVLFLLINLNLVFKASECGCGADYDDGNGTKGDDPAHTNQDTITFLDTILPGWNGNDDE